MILNMAMILFPIVSLKLITNFKNKMLVLMLMESMFLLTIVSTSMIKDVSINQMFIFTMTIFMVMDSTMGISILISSSRNSSMISQSFKEI